VRPTLVTSFAKVNEQQEVVGLGVVIPVKSFEMVPDADPAFQGNVGIEMPALVKDKTFVQLLRINWYAHGHGPGPYAKPHFDLHFYRGTPESVTGIQCTGTDALPANVLVPGYEPPATCVTGMGYHAWPSLDLATNTFNASIILGYDATQMVFVEPMIAQELLLSRTNFEMQIPQPESLGGAPTLFPARVTATYSTETDAYTFEFSQFSLLD
jgi:hypothetical protein